MRRAKSSYIPLLIPVLLFAGAQIFALAAVDNSMPVAASVSHKAEGMELTAATKSHAVVVISDRASIMKSLKVASFRLPGCPVVDCAAPPPGCFYQGPPHTDSRGCPIDCGTLVCDPNGGN